MWPDITEKIQRLASLDKNLVVFGASSHKYERRPTISASELRRAEDRLGTSLPAELRDFYLEWGNGVVGPDYGIYSVEELVSFRPDSTWPGVDAIDAADCTTESFAGMIEVMHRFYDYKVHMVCNGEHCGKLIACEEEQFIYHEADSLHALYSTWLEKEQASLDWYIAAMQSTSDICEIVNRSKDHSENTLIVCASLLGMEGFTLLEALAARSNHSAGTSVSVNEKLRERFAQQIERLAHDL